MKKLIIFFTLCLALIWSAKGNCQNVTFMGISLHQSFESFGDQLSQKATFEEGHYDPMNHRTASFHAYFAGFRGCFVRISEDDYKLLNSIWIDLPRYIGETRMRESKVDYQNLISSYAQKYGKPRVQYDFLADITNSFNVGNVDIDINYIDFSKGNDPTKEAYIYIVYTIRNGQKINSKDF